MSETSDYDVWEQSALSSVRDVLDGLVEIEKSLQLLAQQQMSLATAMTEWLSSAETLMAGKGPISIVWSDLRKIGGRIGFPRHDVEMVLGGERVANSIDLRRLFQTQHHTIKDQPIIISQRSAAILHLLHYNPCHVVLSDQVGIEIPIRVEGAGATLDLSLCMTFDVSRNQAKPAQDNEFLLNLCRGPNICPPGRIPAGLGLMLDNKILEDVTKILPIKLALDNRGTEDIGFPTFFYRAEVCNRLSFLGRALQTPPSDLTRIGPLPSWADFGLKFALGIVRAQINHAVIERDSTVDSITADPGRGAIFAVLLSKGHDEIKTPFYHITADVDVRLTLRCSFVQKTADLVIFQASQDGGYDIRPSTHVSVVGQGIPGVDDIANRLVKVIVERTQKKMDRVSVDHPIAIGGAAQLEGIIQADGLALFAALQ